jgi:hypothetical protein
LHAAQAAPKGAIEEAEEGAEEEIEEGGQLDDWDKDMEGEEGDALQDGLDPEEATLPGMQPNGAGNGLLNGRVGPPQVDMGCCHA